MYSVVQTPFDARGKSDAVNYMASAFNRVKAKAREVWLQPAFGL
jgi:hypothetical protein